ncbi:MAG: Gfo/Idh/MocA family oxidoreductase, partial [Spirochaetota bacterium]
MSTLRVGVIGAGFWARYQIRAWQQIEEVRVTAIFNRTREKAEEIANELEIPVVVESAES